METNSSKRKNNKMAILALSTGISVGTGLGISLGVAFDNLPVGLSIGAGAGISIGMFFYNYLRSKSCDKSH